MGIDFLLNQKTQHDKRYRKGRNKISEGDDLFRRRLKGIRHTFVADMRKSASISVGEKLIATQIGKRVALSRDGRVLAECGNNSDVAEIIRNFSGVVCACVEQVNPISETVDLSLVIADDASQN